MQRCAPRPRTPYIVISGCPQLCLYSFALGFYFSCSFTFLLHSLAQILFKSAAKIFVSKALFTTSVPPVLCFFLFLYLSIFLCCFPFSRQFLCYYDFFSPSLFFFSSQLRYTFVTLLPITSLPISFVNSLHYKSVVTISSSPVVFSLFFIVLFPSFLSLPFDEHLLF